MKAPPINRIVYHKGDVVNAALSGEYDIFMHGCNCMSIMGAGVALQVRSRIPALYKADQDYHIDHPERLGLCSSVIVNDVMMFNLYTQFATGRTTRHLNYGALVSSLTYAIDNYSMENRLEGKVMICLPKIGCGLAGGDWEIVEEILAFMEFNWSIEFHVYNFV
jgi:O-acetyl-ADP-ribose deacetylase (regulator of RNase III)